MKLSVVKLVTMCVIKVVSGPRGLASVLKGGRVMWRPGFKSQWGRYVH